MFRAVTFNLQYKFYEKLRAIAFHEKTTITSLIRAGIENVISERENNKKQSGNK